MIYATPALTDADLMAIEQIKGLRKRLRFLLHEPRRWYESLRRTNLARAVQGSNSIEGYQDDMTYVLQLGAPPPMPPLGESLVKAFHFMMIRYDLIKKPGQWRPGADWVEIQNGPLGR